MADQEKTPQTRTSAARNGNPLAMVQIVLGWVSPLIEALYRFTAECFDMFVGSPGTELEFAL